MQRFIRAVASCGAIAALSALLPLAAAAHETYEVPGGQYEMVIGFIDEPAYVGEKNGLILEVSNVAAPATPTAEEAEEDDHGGGVPVIGLAETLQAEVIFGEETMALELVPSFSDPGFYLGYFFPTAAGDYTFRVFGEIQGTAIDQQFTSSPEGFASVEPIEPLQFPKGEAEAEDGIVVGSVGDASGGLPGGGAGGVLLGTVGLAGAGLALTRRRGRLTAPAAARA